MFGIGMPEMIVILAVALIVIGPKKLPDLAKSLGRALGEFRKATNELKASIAIDDDLDDVKKTFTDLKYDVDAALDQDASTDTAAGTQMPAIPEASDSGPPVPTETAPPKGPASDD